MKPQYEPKTLQQKLGYLVEECGEVLAAVGKAIRWGLHSVNPELPPDEQETNATWILRELDDLKRAVAYAQVAVFQERGFHEHGLPHWHRPSDADRAVLIESGIAEPPAEGQAPRWSPQVGDAVRIKGDVRIRKVERCDDGETFKLDGSSSEWWPDELEPAPPVAPAPAPDVGGALRLANDLLEAALSTEGKSMGIGAGYAQRIAQAIVGALGGERT